MKLMIVDGNSILNRAYYAIRPLSAPDGTPTNAIFGFMNIFNKYFSEQKPDAVAVCFDVSRHTFRHDIYEQYKGTRKGMDDELRVQLPLIKEILTSLGYTCIGLEGYEADDLIGTLSTAASSRGESAVIITGDRDSLQLVDKRVTVLLPSTRAGKTDTTVYTPEKVLEDKGVAPEQIVDLKALMGDSSDNIPGVMGIGEKTAAGYISAFKTLDGVFENIDDPLIKPAAREKLKNGKENAYLSKRLATIERNAPISTDINDYLIKEIDRESAAALFTRLGLIKMLSHYGLSAAQNIEIKADEERENKKELVIEKKAYTLIRFPDFSEIKAAEGPLYYFVRGGLIYICADDKVFITDNFKELFSLDTPLYTYDCKAQFLHAFKANLPLPKIEFDLKLAAYLISATDSDYEFSSLKTRYGKGEDTLSFNCEFGDDIGALEDITSMRYLCLILENRLENEEMLSLLKDIEIPLSETLSSMEFEGFELDSEGLLEFDRALAVQIEQKRAQIYSLAGDEFNINSPKQLGEILFERLGLPAKKKTKTGYSTNAEILEGLRSYHPIINEILEYRKLTKLKSTYTEGLMRQVGEDGKIHTTFLQTETRTGRLSSIEPNLQNIPVRTEIGSRLREFFKAEEGKVLVDADYSQIELRVLAHVADDSAMISAFMEGADIHSATAARVYGLPISMIDSAMRQSAKAVNFGIVYGIGAFSLSQDIKTSVAEAKRLIDSYLENFSGVSQYMKDTVSFGEKHGYVKTLYGRRRYISELSSKNKVLHALGERIAMNTPIQGTAADIIKIAMNRVYARLKKDFPTARLILQVHDELIVQCDEKDSKAVKAAISEEMMSAATLKVSLITDVNIGKNWLLAKG